MGIHKNDMARTYSRLFSNRDLAVLFFPLIIEQALKYSLGLVDSMMVAGVGESAVSGVSLIDFVLSFITSLFAALLVGGSAVISQHIGAGEEKQANDAANQLILLVGLFSLFLCGVLYAAKPFILNRLFGQLAPRCLFPCRSLSGCNRFICTFSCFIQRGGESFPLYGQHTPAHANYDSVQSTQCHG